MANPQPTPSQPDPSAADQALQNQTFAKHAKDLGATSSMTPQEVLDLVLSKDADDIIPWEDAILPSRGVYYDGKIPNGTIQVRAMGIYADKILATQRLAKSGKSLDWLYRKCVKFPSEFDPLNLLANDRTFLLYYLRGITHGNEYVFMVECTNGDCKKYSEQEYDLNKLARTIKGPNTSLGQEPFKVVLPFLSEATKQEFWIKLRLLRGYDVLAMLGARNEKKQKISRNNGTENISLDETLEQNLNLLIVDAMGVKDPVKIRALVERMHASDTATVREFLRDNSPGMDTTVSLDCPYCDNTMKIDLPITDSFFRPKKPGVIRA